MARLLAVDDDADFLELTVQRLRAAGHEVDDFEDPALALEELRPDRYDLVLSDLEMPEMSGIELLEEAQLRDPHLPFILLTGHATVETAVEAMKTGAFDYLKKPFPAPDLLVVIERGLRHRALETENRRLKKELRDKYHFNNLVGNGSAMNAVFRMVERVGPTPSTALILGESGTGKELIARALHETSRRADNPFVRINCSALVDTLLESELFGHEKGSFTGATGLKKGLFEQADGGTLFLDEVGDTSPALQAKLLRVLQEGEIRRVGGLEDIHVDVRMITATNRDLRKRIAEGEFREDLFYRLNVVSIPLPPLRDRKEDIPLLVQHFIEAKAEHFEKPPKIAREVGEALLAYHWPGNIRELENVVERALVLCEPDKIRLRDLPEEIVTTVPLRGLPAHNPDGTLPASQWAYTDLEGRVLSLDEMEKRQIRAALESVHGHREKAANLLGITRRTLYQKIKRYGLLGEGNGEGD